MGTSVADPPAVRSTERPLPSQPRIVFCEALKWPGE
jgi:hypothetical protein